MTDNSYRWDVNEYSSSSSTQQKWARELINKLNLNGNEHILDIGCGDGKVTAEISTHLPKGFALGLDSSDTMIHYAKQNYSFTQYPNLRFQIGDAQSLQFEDKFDIVFSNAALHWIIEHRPVLEGIKKALKKNGRVLLQMGGKGNAAQIFETLDQMLKTEKWSSYFINFSFPYGFYTPEEYREWLISVGLSPQRVILIPKVMIQKDGDALASWIRTTWLPYTQRIPENIREEFIYELVHKYLESYPPGEEGVNVNMVRLEIEAVRF